MSDRSKQTIAIIGAGAGGLAAAHDLAAMPILRQTGGLLNAIAVLLFAACMIYGLRLGAREQPY